MTDLDALRTTCPECRRPVAVFGEHGVIRHILKEHPDTTLATAVHLELERYSQGFA